MEQEVIVLFFCDTTHWWLQARSRFQNKAHLIVNATLADSNIERVQVQGYSQPIDWSERIPCLGMLFMIMWFGFLFASDWTAAGLTAFTMKNLHIWSPIRTPRIEGVCEIPCISHHPHVLKRFKSLSRGLQKHLDCACTLLHFIKSANVNLSYANYPKSLPRASKPAIRFHRQLKDPTVQTNPVAYKISVWRFLEENVMNWSVLALDIRRSIVQDNLCENSRMNTRWCGVERHWVIT